MVRRPGTNPPTSTRVTRANKGIDPSANIEQQTEEQPKVVTPALKVKAKKQKVQAGAATNRPIPGLVKPATNTKTTKAATADSAQDQGSVAGAGEAASVCMS
jgi:hypothetical protein